MYDSFQREKVANSLGGIRKKGRKNQIDEDPIIVEGFVVKDRSEDDRIQERRENKWWKIYSRKEWSKFTCKKFCSDQQSWISVREGLITCDNIGFYYIMAINIKSNI